MSAIKLGAHHDRYRRRSTRGRHWRALFRRRFEAGFNAWKAGTGSRPEGVPTHGDFAAARNPGIDSGVYDAEYAERIAKELY